MNFKFNINIFYEDVYLSYSLQKITNLFVGNVIKLIHQNILFKR
jgi:hypothetical protein